MATKSTTKNTTVVPTIDAGTLAVDYGFALSVLNSNPELKKIFQQAVGGQWTTDKFTAALRNTKWFKTVSASAREWIILQGADPATAKARQAARIQTIRDEAGALGVALTPAQLKAISNQSLMFGWDDNQVKNAISADWKYNPKTSQAGLAAQTIDTMRKAAADYLVPLSDQAIQSWGTRVLAGTATADDFTEYAKQQAKGLFPTLAPVIDRGISVSQYLDPYKQLAAQTLGVAPESVDFTASKWRKAVDGSVDPATKIRAPMSLSDWQATLRSDPTYGYDTTAQGRQDAAALSTQLAQKFGAI